jgi:hypothetical protein
MSMSNSLLNFSIDTNPAYDHTQSPSITRHEVLQLHQHNAPRDILRNALNLQLRIWHNSKWTILAVQSSNLASIALQTLLHVLIIISFTWDNWHDSP